MDWVYRILKKENRHPTRQSRVLEEAIRRRPSEKSVRPATGRVRLIKVGGSGPSIDWTTLVISTSRCLELLHVDLIGPTRTESLGGKRYIMAIIDDFSRYTWVEFLREKSEACEKLEILCKRLQNEKGVPISR